MPLRSKIVSLYRSLFRGDALDDDLDEELRSFVDELTERKITSGLAPQDARRRAFAEAGGIEQVKERVRERRIGAGLGALARDVRYALRSLRRSPVFSLTSTSVLALGIGAGTAVLSLLDGVLQRPLPYPESDRLVVVQVAAVDLNAPGRRCEQAGEHAQHGGLPGAVEPQEPDDLAVLDREAQVVYDAVAVVVFGEALGADHALRRPSRGSHSRRTQPCR